MDSNLESRQGFGLKDEGRRGGESERANMAKEEENMAAGREDRQAGIRYLDSKGVKEVVHEKEIFLILMWVSA
jgi:hypothetical protein